MKKFFITLFFILGLFIAKDTFAQSGGGNFNISYDVGPAPTITLSASPTTVASGGSSTLTWTVANAASCNATGGWSGAKNSTGGSENRTNITSNTTYTLSCSGPGGNSSSSVTVTVASAPTVTLSASPTTVASGGSSTLTWNTTNATSCTASGGWSGSKSVGSNRTENRTNITSNTTYTLSCTGAGGNASDSATVTVAVPAPSVSLSASPTTVASGGSSTLSWSVSNATSCTASGSWSGSKSISGGTQSVTGITSNRTYTLSCTGAGGNASDSATVTVAVPAPVVSLSANPTTVSSGGSSTLSWSVSGATSCTASNGWSGSKSISGGTQSVTGITSNRTYTLSCTGAGGTTVAHAYVSVGAGPSAPTGFTVAQTDPFCHSQQPYAFVNLYWNPVSGATSYTVRNSSGTVIANTSLTNIYYQTYIPPSMQVTFTVTANNANGSSGQVSATGTFVDNNCAQQGFDFSASVGGSCGVTSITLSWDSSQDVYIERAPGIPLYNGIGYSVIDSGLTPGASYNYTLTSGSITEYVNVTLPVACPTDMCLNISGMQATVPAGHFRMGDNCYVNGDMCINIEGTQETVPEGMRQDSTTLECSPQKDITIIEF